MKTFSLQTNFNSGVLDERMSGRVDTKQYGQGMKLGQNILCLPQGGVKRRQGMTFIDDLGGFANLKSFVFNTDIFFTIVFLNNEIKIYFEDALVDTVVSTYQTDDLYELSVVQSGDTMIIAHENHKTRTLVRVDNTTWTLNIIAFTNIPQFDFNDADSPTPVSEIQDITFVGFSVADIYKINLDGVDTEDIGFTGVPADEEKALQQALQGLVNTPSTGISVANTGGTTYRVTFSGSSARDWPLMTGRETTAGGAGTIAIVGIQDGVSRAEDVWSVTRGWPRTVTFHEGRLWFGGSASRPITLWGSNVNDFFNFDAGKGRDDQAIDVTLDVAKLNAITGMFSGRNLQIFTTGSENYIPQSPITPSNVAVRKQTDFGSRRIPPQSIDGAVLFVQRTGKAVQQFSFDFLEDAYQSGSITLLNPSIINDPVDLDVQLGSATQDANYVYLVNSTGRVSVFNTLRAQNVAGWSEWITDGEIVSVAVVVDDVYFVVKRVVEAADVYYLEKAVDETYMDASVVYSGVATDVITGLAHLEGRTVRVYADASVLSDEVVIGGQVTIDKEATNVEVGLDPVTDVPGLSDVIQNMPIEQDIGAGVDMDAMKRIVKATIQMEATNNISIGAVIDGEIRTLYEVPFRSFTVTLDDPPPVFTGKKTMNLSGYGTSVSCIVGQSDPGPMSILTMSLEMEIN